jgi:hypothetical protein
LDKHNIGLQISHGDVAGAIASIRRLRQMPATELSSMGQTAATALNESLSQSKLCADFCDAVANAMRIG